MALLPLTEYLTNCVVTLDSHETESVLTLSPTALAQDIQNRLHHRLGEMTLASDRHSYPLVGVHARRFYGQRSALIGDAAVGMHPVTAHGYNLGLRSADTLSRLVQQAARQGQDIGGSHVLLPYHLQHMLHTRPLYHGTQMMVKLFTNDAPPAKLLRGLVLRASNNLPPLKQLISQQLTG